MDKKMRKVTKKLRKAESTLKKAEKIRDPMIKKCKKGMK